VGVVTAVLTTGPAEDPFGLEVSARGGDRCFLPSVAASVDGRGVVATSALFFGGPDQLDAYVRRGAYVVRAPAAEHGVFAGHDGGTTMS
jgi:hypothetical protein